MTLPGFLVGDVIALVGTYVLCVQRQWRSDQMLWQFLFHLELLTFGIGALLLPFVPIAN